MEGQTLIYDILKNLGGRATGDQIKSELLKRGEFNCAGRYTSYLKRLREWDYVGFELVNGKKMFFIAQHRPSYVHVFPERRRLAPNLSV